MPTCIGKKIEAVLGSEIRCKVDRFPASVVVSVRRTTGFDHGSQLQSINTGFKLDLSWI
jgi:hypothetical protein